MSSAELTVVAFIAGIVAAATSYCIYRVLRKCRSPANVTVTLSADAHQDVTDSGTTIGELDQSILMNEESSTQDRTDCASVSDSSLLLFRPTVHSTPIAEVSMAASDLPSLPEA